MKYQNDMANLKTIQSSISACIAAMDTLSGLLANAQSQVNEYEQQLKVDASIDWFRKSATFFELIPPQQNITVDLSVGSDVIINDSNLQKIHNAFSSAGYLIVINCLDTTNV